MPFMLREYKLSPITIFGAITLIAMVEAASGTTLMFVGTVALTLLFVAITYNLIGGLSTLSGILFTAFALRTIVISQLGKAILFERADGNLEAPMVTISMYALFYFSAMVGMFLYARVRLGLVRPLEPVSPSHSRRLYVIALVVGTIGIVVFERYGLDPDNQVPDNVRGWPSPGCYCLRLSWRWTPASETQEGDTASGCLFLSRAQFTGYPVSSPPAGLVF
jgi:hypothetical protein